LRANPSIKSLPEKKLVRLDAQQNARYLNGTIFAEYLVILKSQMTKFNQEFAINEEELSRLKD
jgi:hypothetical protein